MGRLNERDELSGDAQAGDAVSHYPAELTPKYLAVTNPPVRPEVRLIARFSA